MKYKELEQFLKDLKDLNKNNPDVVESINNQLAAVFDPNKKPTDEQFRDLHTFLLLLNTKGKSIVYPDHFSIFDFLTKFDLNEFKASRQVNDILTLCATYQRGLLEDLAKCKELSHSLPSNQRTPADIYQHVKLNPQCKFTDEIDNLTLKKVKIVIELVESLRNDKTSTEKLTDFNEIFNDEQKRAILETRRDTKCETFLKGVISVLSLGIAVAFGIWKTKAATLREDVEDIQNPSTPKP